MRETLNCCNFPLFFTRADFLVIFQPDKWLRGDALLFPLTFTSPENEPWKTQSPTSSPPCGMGPDGWLFPLHLIK